MKRPFFRKPISPVEKTIPLIRAYIQTLRARILNQIITGALIIGVLAAIVAIPGRIQQGNWTLVILFIVAIVLFLILRFVHAIPYNLRAFLLIAVVAALGVFTFLSDGLAGNGRIYLLAMTILAGILVGTWGSIVSLVSSILFLVVMAILTTNGSITPQVLITGNIPLSYWLIAISTFVLVSTTLSISLIALVNGLESSLRKERELSNQLEVERSGLESRVAQRTKDVERRLVQIRTAADIVRSIGSVLDEKDVMRSVVDLMREGFDLYYVGVFLLDEVDIEFLSQKPEEYNTPQELFSDRQVYAFLRAGTGEEGEQMVRSGHKLLVLSQAAHPNVQQDLPSMVGWAIANRKPRIALDVGQDAVHFDNPQLPQTRSELALPLISGERVLGALTVQSSEQSAFDQDDITAMQSISDSLATALVNARLFQQVQRNLEEIRNLNRRYLVDAWSQVAQGQDQVEYVSEGETEASDGAPSKEVFSIVVPLTLRDHMIGQLTLETQETSLSPDNRFFVDAVVTQAVQALENVRLLDKTQQQAGYERLVADFSRKVRGGADMESILRSVVREVGQALGASEAVIRLDIPKDEVS